nr:DHA2 family efflux MFS transporter permease subunit [Spelaeicoccus albus]
MALGGLLVVLDTTVTIVAIPRIVAEFQTTLPTAQWITTGYLLAIVAVIPTAGWAANRFGARRVYLLALTVFTLASLGSVFSWDIGSLIAFRIIQGLGGGLLNPVGQAIGLRTVSRQRRGRMMALLGLPVVIGPVLGPPLSGWLIDAASWRWIFAINIPIGIAAIILCRAVVPRQQTEPTARLDLPGLILLPTGAVLLVLAGTMVGQDGTLTPTIGATLLAATALLVGFVRRALSTRHPLLDLRLLRYRPLAAGSGVLFCFGAAYFGGMSILPIVVQGVRGDSALTAGLLVIPQAIATGLTLQIATRAVDRISPRQIVLIGVTLGLLGSVLLLLAVTTDMSYPMLAGAAVVVGIGAGATLQPAMTFATRDLEGTQTPNGTTLLALLQQLASALGVAVVGAALTVNANNNVVALHDGGLEAMLNLSNSVRDRTEGALAKAVGTTYDLVATFMLIALCVAVLALRESRSATTTPTSSAANGSSPRAKPSDPA